MLFTDTKYYDNVYFHILTQLNIICDHVSSHIVSLKSIIQQYLLESIDSYYANCEQVHVYIKNGCLTTYTHSLNVFNFFFNFLHPLVLTPPKFYVWLKIQNKTLSYQSLSSAWKIVLHCLYTQAFSFYHSRFTNLAQ